MDRARIELPGEVDPPTMAVQEPPNAMAAAARHGATQAVLLAGALVVVGLLFHELVTLVAAGVITIILAILLSSLAAPLEGRGVPRPLGALLGLILGLALLGSFLGLLVPPLLEEVRGFVDRLPQVADDLARQFATVTGGEPADAGRKVDRALDGLANDPLRFLGPLASFGAGVAGVLSALIIMLITAFYMAANPRPLVAGVVRMFPPVRRAWAETTLERIRAAWAGWLKGVAVDMVVTGALLYIGLALVGLDFAFMFAAMSALLVVIPYFGAIAGGIPPVLVALTHSPELALLTLAVYVVVQQIEGNVIVPLVMARVVKLHPALIAIGVVVVSQTFGLVGVFVAVPLLSAAVILAEELWIRPMELARGVEVPRAEVIAYTSDGRLRRALRERLEREDAHARGEKRVRG